MRNVLPPLLLCASLSVCSQGFLKKIAENKTVSSVLEGKPPITTNFKDVELKGKMAPSFGENETYTSLSTLTKNEDGRYELKPGFYETTNLSYCLKAGTHGPSKGDAYGNAPVLGKMSDIVETILAQSQSLWRGAAGGNQTAANVSAAAITQKDVQLLLWAIIARADFDDMQGKTKATALALLSPEQILKLNGGAVKTVTGFASEKGWVDKPEWMQKMEEAQQSLRQLYKSSNSTYEDFERLAVMAGGATEAQEIEFGTWFKHKDGFYVRFEPQGYSRTHLRFYVPEDKPATLHITGIVATPSDSRQRLAQTDMSVDEYGKRHGH